MADAVADSITALQTAIDAATAVSGGSLARATPPQLAPVLAAMTAALAVTDARVSVVEAAILETGVLGVVAEMNVTIMVETAIEQSRLERESAALRTTRAYLARLNHNVSVVPG